LLYISGRPLAADDIVEALVVARSNVSTSLKELQSWKLVRVTHVLGDRRDHFTALQDVWEIFRVILEERKRREIDPTLTMLRECTIEGTQDEELDAAALARMQTTLEFLEMLSASFQDYQHLSPQTLQRFLKMGGKVARFLGPNDKEPS
jgi:DNA-binding transcriptional regulator GbsR (MarR family)